MGRLLFLVMMSGLFLLTFVAVLAVARHLAATRRLGPPLDALDRAEAIEQAQWRAAHYERDGITHVVVQKAVRGPTGDLEILDRRELRTVAGDDPAWEASFTDAMADARVRADYLNAEESAG